MGMRNNGVCRAVSAVVLMFIVGGCATPEPEPEPPKPTFSFDPPPRNYEQAVRYHFEGTSADPRGIRYRFPGVPVRAYSSDGVAYGGHVPWHGWLVDVEVDERNSFGGYDGADPYMVLFEGDRVARHIGADQFHLITRM